MRNTGIYSSVVFAGASKTERNNTSKFVILNEWTTAISLAGVFSFFSGTDHKLVDFDSVFFVGFFANFTVNYGDFNRLQNFRQITSIFLLMRLKKKLIFDFHFVYSKT